MQSPPGHRLAIMSIDGNYTNVGYAVVPEVARSIIADRKSKGLSPRPSPVEFARAILEKDIERYDSVSDELVFFDRSILDALGMLRGCDALSDGECEEALARFPYSSPVFVFPPWADIYRTDSERDQSFAESVRIHSSINDWYRRCGYDVFKVPVGTIDERCERVLQKLGEQK